MPLTTLNKIIAQFLVGGAVLLVAAVVHWPQLAPLVVGSPTESGQDGQAGYWVLAGLLALPLAGLLGGVVEGFSDATLRKLLKRAKSSPFVASLFLRGQAARDLRIWNDRLERALEAAGRLKWLESIDTKRDPATRRDRAWHLHSAAAGSFLMSAEENEFRWLVEEYASFVLASNLALVVAAGALYVPVVKLAAPADLWWPVSLPFGEKGALVLLTIGLTFWSLCSLAVGKYLYAHEMSARRWCLDLDEPITSLGAEETSQPTPKAPPSSSRRGRR